jgi:hypothetical protein
MAEERSPAPRQARGPELVERASRHLHRAPNGRSGDEYVSLGGDECVSLGGDECDSLGGDE